MAKQVKVSSIIRKLFVEQDGQLVEVKQVDNVDNYGKDVTVYTKELAKGTNKGKTTYCVAVADFKPAERKTKASAVKSLQANIDNMTAEELKAALLAL